MVASGEKIHAVKAALTGGHATHVVLDENHFKKFLKVKLHIRQNDLGV